MKTKPFVLLCLLLFLCAMGQVVYGQYAPPSGPPSLPAYGGQYSRAFAAPGPIHPYAAPMGQFGPVMPSGQFMAMPANWAQQAEDEAPFRVFLAGDDSGNPDKQVFLASTRSKKGKPDRDDGKCDAKDGKCGTCCNFRFFGDYLYLRARDAEVAYAVEANSGVGPPPVQVSPIALLDQDFSSGFRAGFGICLDDCSELVASYTLFETATSHQIVSAPPITQIVSMVIHPLTPAAVTGTDAAAGRHDIDFELIDLDYRRVWWDDGLGNASWSVGVRWGQLEQNFSSVFTDSLAPPIIPEVTVLTDVDFSGAGVRFGLEGERHGTRFPFLVYAKGFASLMAGEFDASYQQNNLGTSFVDTSWTAGRIVPTFDLELGGGFDCCNGCFRATAGYVFSAWTNAVKTDDWIHAVQTNDFRGMNDTMTFDGLVVRVEGRF